MSAIVWTFLKSLLLLTGTRVPLMTEIFFGQEITIGFKNVMLKIKIISKIDFSCKVTIYKFSTKTIFAVG